MNGLAWLGLRGCTYHWTVAWGRRACVRAPLGSPQVTTERVCEAVSTNGEKRACGGVGWTDCHFRYRRGTPLVSASGVGCGPSCLLHGGFGAGRPCLRAPAGELPWNPRGLWGAGRPAYLLKEGFCAGGPCVGCGRGRTADAQHGGFGAGGPCAPAGELSWLSAWGVGPVSLGAGRMPMAPTVCRTHGPYTACRVHGPTQRAACMGLLPWLASVTWCWSVTCWCGCC